MTSSNITTIHHLTIESWTQFHDLWLTHRNNGGTSTKARFFTETWINGCWSTIPSIHGDIEQYWKFAPEVGQYDVNNWL